MNIPQMVELDESRITTESRLFAAELFTRFPELRQYAAMERLRGSEEWTLVVVVPSPSGDPETRLGVWVEDGEEPSVGFGGWHTHEDVWGAGLEDYPPRMALLDLIGGILEDRIVLFEDIGGERPGYAGPLDLSDEEALLNYLTSPYSPECVRLRSWSGKLDRVVSLDDLGQEDTT